MATKKITPEQKSALYEGMKVFIWAGFSAVLPLVIAFLENDPRWAMLAPIVNSIAYAIKVQFENQKT